MSETDANCNPPLPLFNEEPVEHDLVSKFSQLSLENQCLCSPDSPPKVNAMSLTNNWRILCGNAKNLPKSFTLYIYHIYILPMQETHIASLPMEVLINILKWVVSSQLDLCSLENFSMVCRGFYLASRSPDIWRLVCLQTWGLESADTLFVSVKNKLKNSHADNWRNYFIKNPRVHLNGCYIAKMSYMREGERGFQDHALYRAWHVVHYYR